MSVYLLLLLLPHRPPLLSLCFKNTRWFVSVFHWSSGGAQNNNGGVLLSLSFQQRWRSVKGGMVEVENRWKNWVLAPSRKMAPYSVWYDFLLNRLVLLTWKSSTIPGHIPFNHHHQFHRVVFVEDDSWLRLDLTWLECKGILRTFLFPSLRLVT